MNAADFLTECRNDWTRFPRDILGITQWEGQRRIMRSLQKHRRVAVKSGHLVGKTHLVGSLVLTFGSLYPNSRILTTANTFQQVRQNVWGEIRSQYYASRFPLGGEMLNTEWKVAPRWEAVGLSTDKPDSFQGKHAPNVLIIFDECQDINRDIFTAANTMMGNQNCYWLCIANPTRCSGPFFDLCHDPEWHVETLSCLDHPNVTSGQQLMPGVTAQFVEEYREREGEDSPEWAARIMGEFPETDDVSLISMALVAACEDAPPVSEGVHMGVDIARFGGDENVLIVLEDRRCIELESWRGADTMETTGRILATMQRYDCKPESVHIDVIGIGAGVVDRLHEQGHMVDGVNFGEGPQGDWAGIVSQEIEFANRRVELYWACRELLKRGELCIPSGMEFRRVITDICSPRYEYMSDRKIKLEPKDRIKKRIGRSPDHGDALILALSRTGSMVPKLRQLF